MARCKATYKAVVEKTEKGWVGIVYRSTPSAKTPIRRTQNHATKDLAITAINKLILASQDGVKPIPCKLIKQIDVFKDLKQITY